MSRRPSWLHLVALSGIALAGCTGGESTIPDTQQPSITITAPTTEATYLTGDGTITVSGTASDDRGVEGVTYSVAGGPSGTASGTTTWAINGLALSPGQNQLTVTATDGGGNTGTATLLIQRDAEGPQVVIQAPTTSATYLTRESSVTLAGTASDPNGVDRVEYSVDGGASGNATGTTTWTAAELGLSDGENEITITAYDDLGNPGTATLTVTLDQEPPSVSFELPTTATSFGTTEAAIALSGSSSDNVGLDRVEWSIDGGASGTAAGTESWSIGTVDLPIGETVVTVVAHDQIGNSAEASLTITRFELVGSVSLNPGAILTNSGDDIRVTIQVDPTLNLGPGGVRLYRIDGENAPVEEVDELLDNGDLLNGDDILGDGVYSAFIQVPEASPTHVRLQAIADLQGGTEGRSTIGVLIISAPTSPQADAIQTAVQTTAATQLGILLQQGASLESAVGQLVTFIEGQAGVASVVADGVTSIQIKYESGLRGGLFLNQAEGGVEVTRGGLSTAHLGPNSGKTAVERGSLPEPMAFRADTLERVRAHTVPLHQQTVGRTDPPTSFGQASIVMPPEDVIGNQKVLIFAPYEGVWAPYNEGPALLTMLQDSPLAFAINYVSNQDATVQVLRGLAQYGLVILATHGSQGSAFATGEIATPDRKLAYDALRQAGQIGVWTNVTIQGNLLQISADVFVIYSTFIDNLAGSFPQSLIVNNSCESTSSSALSNAFLAKGAETYFGYDKVVSSSFAVDMVLQLIEPMVSSELQTTGDAFVGGQMDPGSFGAEFEMVGNNELRFSSTLINGDFEIGDPTGWTDLGDGRVISQLGPLMPAGGDFMGIISTGLGFTEGSGSLSQSFLVPPDASTLSLNWNFISEEFLEWIGTEFQDVFQIGLLREDGTPELLFQKTIDDIAADFSCPQDGGPGCGLVPVSPGIVFDDGDVHMTGWLPLAIDVTPYRNEIVTIVFSASDVGDSLYDTAILLDDIMLD